MIVVNTEIDNTKKEKITLVDIYIEQCGAIE